MRTLRGIFRRMLLLTRNGKLYDYFYTKFNLVGLFAIDVFLQKSVNATRRMMQNLNETEETGQNTMIMLNEQGEQLDRIEEGMDTVNNEMKEAEKHLTALEKCCGCFQCKKPIDFESNEKYSSTWNKVTNRTFLFSLP